MVRILHLADLHLGWDPPWEQLTFDRKQERDARLAHAVDWALKEHIDLIIIAGDLFETHTPPADLIQKTKNELSRAMAGGISIVTVPGNHDEISYHNSVYREHGSDWPGILVKQPHFGHCHTVTIKGQQVHLYGLAYTGGLTQTSPPLSAFPRGQEDGFHVAIFHGSLDFDAGDRSLPIDRKALQDAGFHYTALGHIHQHLRYGSKTHPIVYPGMIEGKGFDDPGVGHYTVATLQPGGVTIETPPAHTRQIKILPIDVGLFANEDELVESLTRQINDGDMLRLRMTGSPEFPFYPGVVESKLVEKVAFIEIVDETDKLSDEVLQNVALEPTIQGAFVQRMIQKLKAAQNDGERRLIRRALIQGLAALEGSENL